MHLPGHGDGLAEDQGDRLVRAGLTLLLAGQHRRHPHRGAGWLAGVQCWELGASD